MGWGCKIHYRTRILEEVVMNYKKLDELCRQSIEDYDEKVSMAWGYMDRNRCPLWMAFPILYDEIREVLEDNEIDLDEVEIEEIISA